MCCSEGFTLRAEPLLSLAAAVVGEHRIDDVLKSIVGGLAQQPGVALARIWLVAPGDICADCFLQSECHDKTQCLHLVASAGTSVASAGEDWSFRGGRFRRIPKNHRKVGRIGVTGDSVLIKDFAPENEWIAHPDWARSEGIRAFAGHPLITRGKIIGVLAIFSREPLEEQDFTWLRMFADQAAAAITSAQAFEALVKADAAHAEHARELKQVIDVAPLHMFIW